MIKKWHCHQSMSRADNGPQMHDLIGRSGYDNAVAKSLFSRFKAELLQNGAFLTIEDAKTKIFEYIELYYNRIRRHSALGYESPNQFQEKYYKHSISLASRGTH